MKFGRPGARYAAAMMILALALSLARAVEPDVVIADFEGPTYGDWTATGEAFGPGPAQGTLPNQMKVSGHEGKSLVNSFHGGDRTTGRLTSPEFAVSRRAITFLIGGGGWEGKTCMNLVVDGKVVRTAVGPNVEPGGSEALERMSWDVSPWAGKQARLEIIDDATGGWGHINVDQIVQTDRPPAGVAVNTTRVLKATRRYLTLPVKADGPVRRLQVEVDGKVVREFGVQLAEGVPDWWAFVDVSAWKGQDVTVRAARLPADGAALKRIEASDELKGREPLYQEKLRPQVHFSSKRGWINDPNGMVYHDGEYHLYYQHSPFTWFDNPKHWGHAVSRDLVHWEELPTAIVPHAWGDWVWSGSAVVDAANTAGWKTGKEDVIVAAYTSTGRGECIVYSNDRGRTFQEFAGNPVVRHEKGEGRDPRLFRYGEGKDGRWVMAVYDEDATLPEPERRGVAFHTSPDLKAWTFASRIGGFYECPDMFELPVDGGKAGTKWVLTAADSTYMLGTFDGTTFTPDTMDGKVGRKHPGNSSDTFYAAQTFSQTPDGRRIQIGWGRIDAPGMPFNQMMSFPCELTLRTTPDGVRMFAWPVKEIEKLVKAERRFVDVKVALGETWRPEASGELLDVEATFGLTKALSEIRLVVRGMPVVIRVDKQEVACGGRTARAREVEGQFTVRVLADRTSLEVFVNGGETSLLLPGAFVPGTPAVEVNGGTGVIPVRELVVRELKSAWE